MVARFKILYVYILQCSDGTYYTGVTRNLENRLLQHNLGVNKTAYTYTRRPVKLIYYESFSDYLLAIDWESRINKWSNKKKRALAESDWNKLRKASECKNPTSHKFHSKFKLNKNN